MIIGEILKKTREDKGISLADVENETKIRRKYIQALENDDFDVLPGSVYVKGFLRSYARYLGLDEEEIVRQYEEIYGERKKDEFSEISTESTTKRHQKSRLGIIAVTAVLVMIAIAYIWGVAGTSQDNDMNDMAGINNKQNISENSNRNNARPGENNAERGAGVGESPAEQGVNTVFEVTGGDCWMHVIVDDQDAFQGLVEPGSIKRFHGEKFVWVKLGDAGTVRAVVNGDDYGFLGNRGEVVTRVFRAGEDEENTAGS